MGNKDYMETFKDGINLMGKMAVKGVSAVSNKIKGDEKIEVSYHKSGLYFQRHIAQRFGDIIPRMQFFEPVSQNRLTGGFVKKLVRSTAEKSFVAAGFSLMFGDSSIAINKLTEALISDPQYTDCYFLLGTIHLEQGDYEKAEENFFQMQAPTHRAGKENL